MSRLIVVKAPRAGEDLAEFAARKALPGEKVDFAEATLAGELVIRLVSAKPPAKKATKKKTAKK